MRLTGCSRVHNNFYQIYQMKQVFGPNHMHCHLHTIHDLEKKIAFLFPNKTSDGHTQNNMRAIF